MTVQRAGDGLRGMLRDMSREAETAAKAARTNAEAQWHLGQQHMADGVLTWLADRAAVPSDDRVTDLHRWAHDPATPDDEWAPVTAAVFRAIQDRATPPADDTLLRLIDCAAGIAHPGSKLARLVKEARAALSATAPVEAGEPEP